MEPFPTDCRTPAFVYDEALIDRRADLLVELGRRCGLKPLYSIKALPFLPILEGLAAKLAGFSVSSANEAKLAALAKPTAIHLTTPGLTAGDLDAIGRRCDAVAFNSLEQFDRFASQIGAKTSVGIRVNPGLSQAQDVRYDPSRPNSKLGVPLRDLVDCFEGDASFRRRVKGLHFHNTFAARRFVPMQESLALIERHCHRLLDSLEWFNLGGGFLFETSADLEGLADLVSRLRAGRDFAVFCEPGNALVGDAGYLVGSVIDRFERDGKIVIVLDTSVSHHPELFEYQRRPQLLVDEPDDGDFVWVAGCSCLAGDLFGEYRFASVPMLGDRLVFKNVGAYSLIKASRFNGYNLPSIYAMGADRRLRLMKTDTDDDFLAAWRAP